MRRGRQYEDVLPWGKDDVLAIKADSVPTGQQEKEVLWYVIGTPKTMSDGFDQFRGRLFLSVRNHLPRASGIQPGIGRAIEWDTDSSLNDDGWSSSQQRHKYK